MVDAEVMEFVPSMAISAVDTPTDTLVKVERTAFLL